MAQPARRTHAGLLIYFGRSALTLLVGWQEGHPPYPAFKKLGVGVAGGDDLSGALHAL